MHNLSFLKSKTMIFFLMNVFFTDNAYACDPRIQKFKDDEKEKKMAQKRAKQEAARQKAEEEARVGLITSLRNDMRPK